MRSHQASEPMSDYKPDYNIDIVFCVDLSSSMKNSMAWVKSRLLEVPNILIRCIAERDRTCHIRSRIVTFGSSQSEVSHLEEPTFRTSLSEYDSTNHIHEVQQLNVGSELGDTALALASLDRAINSNWSARGILQRHIIMVFTNHADIVETHNQMRKSSEVATNRNHLLKELRNKWESIIRPEGRRLLIFAPDAYPWNGIGDSWDHTLYLPSDSLGANLSGYEFETMIDMCFRAQ